MTRLLSIYPNPVKAGAIEVNITYPGNPCNNSTTTLAYKTIVSNDVKIYDLYGNLVLTRTYDNDKFTVSGIVLKKGHYIVNVTTANGDKLKSIVIVE